MSRPLLQANVAEALAARQPVLWLNPNHRRRAEWPARGDLTPQDVFDAERTWQRFAPLLAQLFPELQAARGVIESPLFEANALQTTMMGEGSPGRWLIKGDHALPVAGSIKARGGIYEVLVHAERLALREGVLTPQEDRAVLASAPARALLERFQVAVGSTGNLGLGVGIAAAALGFRTTVHMSAEAKEWKKARLRVRGVEVVEHAGDFSSAVAAGREQSLRDPSVYFVDDENSRELFLGYSAAAIRLQAQLEEKGIVVDEAHPLFVYIPCGVGGAPGGITFGLRQLFGDAVHCFFAEPLASPCMLVRLASCEDRPLSVYDVGLDNRTEADGLAVSQASEFVAPLMRPLVSGIFTVPDENLFVDLYLLETSEGLRIEPSAAAGFRGPRWILESEAGQAYLRAQGLGGNMHNATHVLWTTGGAFVPEEEYARFHARGRTGFRGTSLR